MNKYIVVLGFAGLLAAAGQVVAAEADAETVIAQCTNEAKAANVQDQDLDAAISKCLDEKMGYAKEE